VVLERVVTLSYVRVRTGAMHHASVYSFAPALRTVRVTHDNLPRDVVADRDVLWLRACGVDLIVGRKPAT
jgi:hypothetical protein